MRELPILFSTPMVQAILNDWKFLTRRVMKIQPDEDCYYQFQNLRHENGKACCFFDYNNLDDNILIVAPYQPGDILWVRETFATIPANRFPPDIIVYRSTLPDSEVERRGIKWKPNIFMKKDYARIWLEVVNVHGERLHDITPEDAILEGIQKLLQSSAQKSINGELYRDYLKKPELFNDGLPAVESFRSLWIKINGQESWNDNPWVWRAQFKVLSKTGRPDGI